VHDLDAGDGDRGRPEVLEAEHRPGHPFDRPMVLLDEVIEVLDLADLDPGVMLSTGCGFWSELTAACWMLTTQYEKEARQAWR